LEGIKEEHARDYPGHLPLLFRGQEKSVWSLSTTLERVREGMSFADYYHVIERIKPQVESFTNSEWPIPDYYPTMLNLSANYDGLYSHLWAGPRPEYPYMAYLRHHAFPSPLLDWTRSAFVAAFFAFHTADELSTDYVSVFACTTELPNKLHGNDMPLVLRYGPYVKTDRRHFLQQSEYTLCVRFYDQWKFEPYRTVFDPGLHQQGRCWKFDIPITERRKALIELNEYNLNAWSLFGSAESMMETLATKEFCLRDDNLPSTPPSPSPEGGAGTTRVRHLRPA
jgi:hypothetical protein